MDRGTTETAGGQQKQLGANRNSWGPTETAGGQEKQLGPRETAGANFKFLRGPTHQKRSNFAIFGFIVRFDP